MIFPNQHSSFIATDTLSYRSPTLIPLILLPQQHLYKSSLRLLSEQVNEYLNRSYISYGSRLKSLTDQIISIEFSNRYLINNFCPTVAISPAVFLVVEATEDIVLVCSVTFTRTGEADTSTISWSSPGHNTLVDGQGDITIVTPAIQTGNYDEIFSFSSDIT